MNYADFQFLAAIEVIFGAGLLQHENFNSVMEKLFLERPATIHC